MLKKIWNLIINFTEATSRARAARVLINMGLHEEARRVILKEN